MRTTCQFNSKVFSKDPSKPHLWCSTPLNNFEFNEDKTACYADDCALELSEDGNEYTIKSMNDEKSIVNLKITRTAPGFKAGKSGTTQYGTDLENPWGSIRHVFWPRCAAEGTITTPDGPVDFKGRAMYSFALQGMKPHHAAGKWNFANFQGPNYSAIMMEFTTPPSYGSTVVNVGGIVNDKQIITAGPGHEAIHTEVKNDSENEWPEPSSVKFEWTGNEKDAKPTSAVLEGPLGDRTDRVDVMAEVPGFVKTIVAAAAGTKPYIYQVCCHFAVFPVFLFSRYQSRDRAAQLTRNAVRTKNDAQAQDWRRRNHRRRPAIHGGYVHHRIGRCENSTKKKTKID